MVRRSGKVREGTNFRKVEANNKIVKSGGISEISSCSGLKPHPEYASLEGVLGLQSTGQSSALKNSIFDRLSRNHDKTWRSPKQSEFDVSRNVDYGQAELIDASNVISKQHGFDKNFANKFTGGVAFRGGGKEINHKLHHGYPRTWFGCQSTKSKDYLPCSLEEACTEQSSSKPTRIQKRLEKKTNKTASCAPITLLKRNDSRNVGDVVLSAAAERAEQSDKTMKYGNKKQEATVFGRSSGIEELTKQLNKQRLDTSGESCSMDGLPAARVSPKSVVDVKLF